MTPSELRTRAVRETGAGVVVLALTAAWFAGAPGFVGVAAAGAITLANFWWLVRGVSTTVSAGARASTPAPAAKPAPASGPAAAAGPAPAAWIVVAAARFLVLLAAFAALCATGWADPVAVVVGLTVLPCNLIALGVRSAHD